MNAKANLYGPAMEPDLHQAPEPKWPSAAASVFVWAQQQLKPDQPEPQTPWELQAMARELQAAQAELNSLHALLEDIPDIFERKFEQRLQPLLAENQTLRQQLLQLKQAQQAPAAQVLLPAKAIRHAFALGLGRRDLGSPRQNNGHQPNGEQHDGDQRAA